MDTDKNLSRRTSNSGIAKKKKINNRKSDKELHPRRGLPPSNKQEQATDTLDVMERFLGRATRERRLATGYRPCDSISVTCPANLTAESGLETGWGQERELTANENRDLTGVM